jgi:hypothetical protein
MAIVSLRDAYDASADVLAGYGVTPDTYRVVQEVERLREYWRPKAPKGLSVILLAESHVATREQDFGLQLDRRALQRHGLEWYPTHFVRFVYCLGAGERELLPSQARPENGSKWQFWRLLWSCAHDPSREDFDLTRKATPDFDERMGKKVRLLRTLQRRGVWLLDASMLGINGLAPRIKREVTSVSWEGYVGPRVQALDPKPRRLIVIGKRVAETIFGSQSREGMWSGIPYEVVNQPQGDRSQEDTSRTLSTIFRICCGPQAQAD